MEQISMKTYGKLRDEDVPVLKSAVEIFKKHNLRAGLHGTSLWNSNYKDVDLLVISPHGKLQDFNAAFEELKTKLNGKVLGQKGDASVGLDYDVDIGKVILHISYVILL